MFYGIHRNRAASQVSEKCLYIQTFFWEDFCNWPLAEQRVQIQLNNTEIKKNLIKLAWLVCLDAGGWEDNTG